MRTILSAFVLSTLALAAPFAHADEAKPAAAATEKAPVKKSTKATKKSEAKPAEQKTAQPRRSKTVRRSSVVKTAK